ncbi:MAG: YidC/Oxa1 family insertase periplasmic-domain containing protein, partial [Muribaculaceae bacterium]|nr:YidC/Oxa1 family insertase periplasmic-domain containing protein [Muribaculaceae bacterium]
MDKNTGIGLLLMAAVFFGFMWLSPKKEAAAIDDDDTTAPTAVQPSSTDSLTATEKEWLVKNIIVNGDAVILPDSTRASHLKDGNIDLTVAGNNITGTVNVNGKTLDWNDVANTDLTKMSALEQRKAVEIVRTASLSMGKYGKFARFLTGSDSIIRMENDVLKLEFSAKSGTITRAELKKYDTEYTPDESQKRKEKVVIFENGTNSLSFQLPLVQSVSTAELYFTPQILNDSTIRMTLPVADDAFWGIEYTLPKGDSYVIGMKVVQKNMTSVVESNNRNLVINWQQELMRQEKGKMFEERNSTIYYKYAGGDVESLKETSNDDEEVNERIKWIGFKNQFFSTVFIARNNFNRADLKSQLLTKTEPAYLKDMDVTATVDYSATSAVPASFDIY